MNNLNPLRMTLDGGLLRGRGLDPLSAAEYPTPYFGRPIRIESVVHADRGCAVRDGYCNRARSPANALF